MTGNTKSTWFAAVLIVIIGLAFALAGPVNMVMEGPFSWHIKQPAFWQGGLELMVVAILVGIAIYFLKGWQRGLMIAVVALLYTRHHGVDFALVISLIYFEGIGSFGLLILRLLKGDKRDSTERYLLAIVLGLLTWGCIEWILSAAGIGSVHQLQIAAIVVVVGSLLIARRPPLLAHLYSNLGERQVASALAGAFLCAAVLMMFAKSAVSLDYDSLWYAIRGNRVLVSGGSAFDPLGLVSVVFYYPKAYGLLLMPLNGLRSIPSIVGFSIWTWSAFGVCLYAIGCRLRWPRALNLLAVSVALATPAVLNISITAKGDVMGAMWLFFGLWAMFRYQTSRDWRLLILTLSAAMVATMFRPVDFLFAGILVLMALALFARKVISRNLGGHDPAEDLRSVWLWVVLASCVWFVLVTVRTLLVSGVPFVKPDFMVHIAQLAGFSVRYPVGIVQLAHSGWQPGFLDVLFQSAFRPARLPHILITWVGSAFVFLPLAGIIFWKRRGYTVHHVVPLAILALTYPFILATTHGPVRGDDGNYFIIPVVAAILLGVHLLGATCMRKNPLGSSLRFVCCAFVVVFTLVALVTGDWGPGTSAWNGNFSQTTHDAPKRARAHLAHAKMMDIYRYLKVLPADTRVIGLIPHALIGAPGIPGAWLPVRYEAISDIANRRPGLVASPSAIREFLSREKIQYVILPAEAPTVDHSRLTTRFRSTLHNLLVSDQASLALADSHYVMWKLHVATSRER